jgi:hypothetical protein
VTLYFPVMREDIVRKAGEKEYPAAVTAAFLFPLRLKYPGVVIIKRMHGIYISIRFPNFRGRKV